MQTSRAPFNWSALQGILSNLKTFFCYQKAIQVNISFPSKKISVPRMFHGLTFTKSLCPVQRKFKAARGIGEYNNRCEGEKTFY